jgi:hypothetical protein
VFELDAEYVLLGEGVGLNVSDLDGVGINVCEFDLESDLELINLPSLITMIFSLCSTFLFFYFLFFYFIFSKVFFIG